VNVLLITPGFAIKPVMDDVVFEWHGVASASFSVLASSGVTLPDIERESC